ncbi:type II toxin-antitoxin system RelE/ParE family toxin [Magnetovibrio blakemorei]|uniref:Toxin n=1 Tax=Magnetovibrio blakemorei TaxID=28181 RepID=A0A1E5Q9V9_9PROT|nr:type II toxin-antitoxin system RelE/ParE family toxin [Magnetovibrio blakemorei]OEJ68413.1 plasmid stabilization protein [Magnetovibrio blakemorei]
MGTYKLTQAAAADFEHIFDFGIDTFGLEQALAYQNGLKQRFDELSEQPELFPAVEHLRKGYRRSSYGSHAIYYGIEEGGVVIVRILGQQNLEKAF